MAKVAKVSISMVTEREAVFQRGSGHSDQRGARAAFIKIYAQV